MEKIVYVVWSALPGDEVRERLLALAPRLRSLGAVRYHVHVHDAVAAETPSPAPRVLFEEPPVALAHLVLPRVEDRWPLEDALRAEGFTLAGYHVEEQVYTEYGGNQHGGPRTWPDGERSPGVVAVTLMERPRRLSRQEWIRRWHGRQSPMSEAMQPRCRYVRNVVLAQLTHGAPPFEGIVEESWPSSRHVTNPFLFYGAKNVLELAKNMAIMLRSVTAFLDLWRIRTVMTSEYFVATGWGDEGDVSPPA